MNYNEQMPNFNNTNGKTKKNNILLLVIIFILAISLALACGYIIGNNNNKESENVTAENSKLDNEKKQEEIENQQIQEQQQETEKQQTQKQETENQQEQEPTMSREQAMQEGKKLLNVLTNINSVNNEEFYSNQITEYAKNNGIKATELNHEVVYQVILNKFYSNKPKEIKLDEFNSNVSKVFDDSYKYVAKDYYKNCSGDFYKLDNSKKRYYREVNNYGGCGGTGSPLAAYKITNAYLDGSDLIVEIKVIFGKYKSTSEGRTVEYYSDYGNTKLINNANVDNYDNYVDQGSTYKFTFKYNNGNYVFLKTELA